MLGCPVQSLFWSRGGPWPWSPSMVLRSSCLVSPWLFAVVAFSCHGKQSHHLTSPSHQRPRLGPFSSSPCFTVTQVGTVSLSHSLARLAPAAAAAPPDCKSSLVYQICVLGQENSPLHTASGRALPTTAKRKPDVDFQSIGNLPESVSRNSQGSPSHSRTARPKPFQSNGGAGLQFQVDGPFLHPPIRAPRNGTHYGMIFRHPPTPPTVDPKWTRISSARGGGREGATGK